MHIKALVLSCNTGGGHNAAGKAVYGELLARGHECEFVDALSMAGGRVSKNVAGCYNFITTRAPEMFHLLYSAGGAVSRMNRLKRKSPIYYVNKLYAQKMKEYIEAGGFDIVIMPHLFPAETMTVLKNRDGFRVRTVAIATDYTCIPFWEETEPDYFVIPHPDLAADFTDKGIPGEKLVPLGIPVQKPFWSERNPEEAKRKLGLESDKPLYLVMTGSMGAGNITAFVKGLAEHYGDRVNAVILCGNNDKIRKKLIRTYGNWKNFRFQEFTDRVPDYMDACDVIFTKPGGLTSTEAAAKNIPMIHTDPIPGCETKNAGFFSERGMSLVSSSVAEQLKMADLLCSDESRRNEMLLAQRRHVNPNACGEICNFVEELCGAK